MNVNDVNTHTNESIRDEIYKAMIVRNIPYYLLNFGRIKNQKPRNYKPTWNWAAFLFSGPWLLYRKMYSFFVMFCFFCFINILINSFAPPLAFFLFVISWIAFSLFANHIYYRHVNRIISVAEIEISDIEKSMEYLKYRGGVHNWVPWGFVAIFIFGILLALLIPQFADKKSIRSEGAYEAAPPPPPLTNSNMKDIGKSISEQLYGKGKEASAPAPTPAPGAPRDSYR